MLKILRIIVISATLMASAVTSFADEPCFEPKVECLEYVRELAEWGDAEAQYFLGLMYYKRVETRQNKIAAAKWFRLAADQGDMNSQYYLGVMYENAEGVSRSDVGARGWYSLAAEQGHAKAQYNLGEMHEKGKGVNMDKREALDWYRLAAEQEYVKAQNKLGQMYFEGEAIAKDKREALRWYRLAAEQGNANAQNKLGQMYFEGEGIAKDKREALRWHRLAAEQGNANAQNSLGMMYFRGEGVVKDEHESYVWYLIAKAGGDKNADRSIQNNLWTLADFGSAKIEAVRRFGKIKNRGNDVKSSDNNSVQKSDREFAIAKPPKETNIAAEVFENTWRSVVMIKNAEGQGSGVIIRPNLVATNCHVVEGGGVAVYKPENGRVNESMPFSAKVIYRKKLHDFCILEVKGLWGIAAIIRKYDTLKVGENVYALGAPSGLDLSLSNGLISQLRINDGTRFIQTDAAISPGSSGGGLFDTKGNFIGILTSKYVGEDVEGIGFAIPADLVLEF